MLIVNNKALKITNKWLNPVAGSGPTPPGPTPPTYYHVYTSATNGTITATPVSGISGTTVTLSNTPDTGYEFDSYSLTGATLYDTNKFDIDNSDVNVVGNFIAATPVYIDPWIPPSQEYATVEKQQFEAKGADYNSSYKLVSDNMSSVYYFSYVLYDANSSSLKSGSLYSLEFNMNDKCTQSQYNDMSYFTLFAYDSNYQPIDVPSDLKLQLLS